MALDGIVIKNMVAEMQSRLVEGRISRIMQPEPDELMLVIKNRKDTCKLFVSADAGLPLIYFTDTSRQNPATAPNFCMLLRKHIGNGRIVSVSQPGLERIVDIEIEHLDEMGDLCIKHLIFELMGKHSNIIFCDENKKIIDSIKHVSAQMSSVREVLPGREYFIPDTQNKKNPLDITLDEILPLYSDSRIVYKFFYSIFTGISPLISQEIAWRAGIDSNMPVNALSEAEKLHLSNIFLQMMESVKQNQFTPNIVFEDGEPKEFSALLLESCSHMETQTYSTMSEVLEFYYAARNQISNMKQKTAEMRKNVQTLLERARKKYDLQEKQLKDTEKREKYRIYGELLTAYGYTIEAGQKKAVLNNYYTGEDIIVPLDENLSPQENAKKYFERYNKLKRTYEALTDLIQETGDEVQHLESIAISIDLASSVEDLVEIKQEMYQAGYSKKNAVNPKNGKKQKVTSKPHHYRSYDGFDIYVGKNNFQNEEVTFKLADGGDIWMHAKNMPGSHVIIKTGGREVPDRTYEEGGRLAAYYSKGREGEKVEIDYIPRKYVKKPAGGKPGFVIYHTNYSLMAAPNIDGIEEIQ
ncbi:MAG: NFACT family protein [Lachnospiraceae bacterium]